MMFLAAAMSSALDNDKSGYETAPVVVVVVVGVIDIGEVVVVLVMK